MGNSQLILHLKKKMAGYAFAFKKLSSLMLNITANFLVQHICNFTCTCFHVSWSTTWRFSLQNEIIYSDFLQAFKPLVSLVLLVLSIHLSIISLYVPVAGSFSVDKRREKKKLFNVVILSIHSCFTLKI